MTMAEVNGRVKPHWSLTAGQILVVLVLAAMLYAGHQMYWPVKVLDVDSIEILTPVVVAGDKVKVRFYVNKHLLVPMKIERSLVNNTVVPYIEESPTQPLGRSVKTIELLIPKDRHEGPHRIRTSVHARVNYFRMWTMLWESPDFYVVDPVNANTAKIKTMQKDIKKLEEDMEKNNKKLKGVR
jgi:hypothetical protein